MSSPKRTKAPIVRARTLAPRPEHLVGQQPVRTEGVAQARRELFRLSLCDDDEIRIVGTDVTALESWRLHRYRRSDGEWHRDDSQCLFLGTNSTEKFRDALIREAHESGSAAPWLSFEYQSERYRNEIEADDDSAIVPHLVLKALALALGNGDLKAAGHMGREALKYIRTQLPDFVTPGDGDGLLDQKGDSGRIAGKERLLRVCTEFCRDHEDDSDYEDAASQLGFWVERLHPKAVRSACKTAAEVARASRKANEQIPPALGEFYARLERALQTQTDPTPEGVARLALLTLGVETEKVAHYFDYRYTGTRRAESDTIRPGGAGATPPFYVAKPDWETEPTRAVIVLPSMFGVNDHVKQVARRLARAGYLAVVPHFLRDSIRPEEDVERLIRFARNGRDRTEKQIFDDLAATLEYLREKRNIVPLRVGLLGFEAGAAATHAWLGSEGALVGAAIAFYGAAELPVPSLRAPLLTFMGDRDPWFTMERRDSLRRELTSSHGEALLCTFEGAGRGFFDPGFERERGRNPPREPTAESSGYFSLGLSRYYHPTASHEAWEMTLAFLRKHLGTQSRRR
ncbi:MAG: dienelactone hydrolase family protein [Myxococcaceae bacterium]|nr:MAG: dienelactone hydrolase family protein [Myxococcaceae bacterium]